MNDKAEKFMKYDVALSFAGEDRKYVEAVATELKRLGVRVFYDNFETAGLWGKDLSIYLQDIYQKQSKYTVIFISKYYSQNMWTIHELKAILARALECEEEYVLPARFDGTEIKGINKTIAYIELSKFTEIEFSNLIYRKIKSQDEIFPIFPQDETIPVFLANDSVSQDENSNSDEDSNKEPTTVSPKNEISPEYISDISNTRKNLDNEWWFLVFGILILLIFVIYYFISFQTPISGTFSISTYQYWIYGGNLLVSLYFLSKFSVSKKILSVPRIIQRNKFYELLELNKSPRQKSIDEKSDNIFKFCKSIVATLIEQYIKIIQFIAAGLVFLYINLLIYPTIYSKFSQAFGANILSLPPIVLNFIAGILFFNAYILLRKEIFSKSSKRNISSISYLIVLVYTITLFSFLIIFPFSSIVINFFNGIALLTNAVAMCMLFGKYISLETSFSKEDRKSFTKIIPHGIAVTLFIYAISQVIFISFDERFERNFSSQSLLLILYCISLIGKICFFQVTYFLLKKKLLHLYFYGLVSKNSNFEKSEKPFVD